MPVGGDADQEAAVFQGADSRTAVQIRAARAAVWEAERPITIDPPVDTR